MASDGTVQTATLERMVKVEPLANAKDVRTETMWLTPAQAQVWLAERAYPRQRRVRTDHVDFLANEMRMGRFLPTAQIGFVCLNGSVQNVNGQHTMHAIIKSGKPQLVNVVYHFVQSQEEADELYSSYDRGVSRTWAEVLTANQLADKMGMTPTQAGCMASTARILMGVFVNRSSVRRTKLSYPDAQQICLEYADAGRQYFEITENCPRAIRPAVNRSATLSIALLTLKHATQHVGFQKVHDFWHGSVFDDGVKVGDPRKLVNRHFMTAGMSGGGYQTGGARRKIVSYEYALYYLARCWKAWADGEELKIVQAPTEVARISVAYTPY